MAAFEVEYWLDLPLEMIEHGCAPGVSEECWRVAFGIVRCSLFFAIGSKFAVRPRFRRGGFKGWVEAFQARAFGTRLTPGGQAQKKPLKARDLDEEMPDTDNDGNPVSLTLRDLAAILAMDVANVRRGYKEAIRRGLVLGGEKLYPNPKPSFLPKDPEKVSTDSFNIAGIRVSTDSFPKDEILKAKALAYAVDVSTRWMKALNALRTEFRNELRERGPDFSLLISKRGRSKIKDTVRPSLPVMEEQRSAANRNGRTVLTPLIVEELRHIGEVFPKWSRIDNPEAAAQSIAEACDYDQQLVTAVFQNFAASVRESDANIKSAVGLLIARARRFQQGRATGAGA